MLVGWGSQILPGAVFCWPVKHHPLGTTIQGTYFGQTVDKDNGDE